MTDANKVLVNFALKRRIGQDELTFAATSYASANDEGFEYNRLMGIASDALKDYINSILPTMPTTNIGAGSGEWYEIDRLSVTIDKGKRYVKAHFARWEEYGLPIWPEVAKKINFVLDKVPLEGYKPRTKLEAFVVTDDKNRARIAQLRIDTGAK